VGNALFETGAAPLMGKKIISLVGTNEKVFIAALIVVAIPISAFLSNTATAAIMLPLAASSIGMSGGRLTKKNTYMIVGMAAVTGGGLTLVSSPPQMIAQNLLIEGGHEPMGFFDIGVFGLPLFALLLVYSLTIGYRLQKKSFNFSEPLHTAPIVKEEKIYMPMEIARMCIAVGVLVICVTGFVREWWSPGVIAMLGAAVCIATGCISQKKAYEKMDWTTLIIFGSSFGFAAGLEQSGAGVMIAQGTIALLGSAVTPWLLCAVLALIAVVLTNFMSSTATAALLLPIGIFSAIELGYDVRSVAMAVAIAASIGYATPMATPPMTMTLAGGYRFKDYIKMGGLYNILAYLLVVALFPLVLNL
jgi:anion transporter